MTTPPVNRRLSAILAADVVGYSQLMERDDAGTLAALNALRKTRFRPAVARHNGRIVKLMGDGAPVEFASVVDAVGCAIAIQRAAADDTGPSAGIALRIGVNLGDIITQDDDIFGDGVNIAARLEQLARPGGICISSVVNESIGSRITEPCLLAAKATRFPNQELQWDAANYRFKNHDEANATILSRTYREGFAPPSFT